MKNIFKVKLLIAIISISFLGRKSWAFPEMRFLEGSGCISCHFSPTGGGILKPLGRKSALSQLSTWGSDGEQSSSFGYFKSMEHLNWLAVGGDFRLIKVQKEMPPEKISKVFIAQRDFEIGILFGRFELIGAYSGPEYPSGTRRNWILYNLGSDWRIRVGKFQAPFGINTAHHFLATRDALDFGIQSEHPGIEISKLALLNEFYFSAFKDDGKMESSQTLQWNTNENNSLQLGLGFQRKSNLIVQQDLVGAHFISGEFNNHIFWGEIDLSQYKDLSTDKTFQGAFEVLQFKYWLHQGLSLIVFQDSALKKIYSSSQQRYSLGLGVEWNPRPHWQLEGIFQEIQDLSFGPEAQNRAILELHFYL